MYNHIRALYQRFGPPHITNFDINAPDPQLPQRAGVFVLADRAGKIVLIRRCPEPKHPGIERYWWIPGGAHEPGEELDEAVRREFTEETGLEVRLKHLLMTGIRHKKNAWLYVFFRGEVCGGTLSHHHDPDQTTAAVRAFAPPDISVQDLWSDFDKIVLAHEGVISYSIDELLEKHALRIVA
jgi:ADP-ribose pyrophosphatase YjhB (NUDIX family)